MKKGKPSESKPTFSMGYEVKRHIGPADISAVVAADARDAGFSACHVGYGNSFMDSIDLFRERGGMGQRKFRTLKDHIRKSTGKVKIVAYVYKKSVPNEKSRVRKQTLLGSKFESGEMNRYSLAKSVNIYRKIFYILRYCKGLMPYLFLNK